MKLRGGRRKMGGRRNAPTPVEAARLKIDAEGQFTPLVENTSYRKRLRNSVRDRAEKGIPSGAEG